MYIRVNSPLRVLHLTEFFLAFFIYYLGTLIFKDFRILVVSQGHKGNYCATVIMHPIEIKCYLSIYLSTYG